MTEAERWEDGIGGPAYAIDDQTAITVTGRGALASRTTNGFRNQYDHVGWRTIFDPAEPGDPA